MDSWADALNASLSVFLLCCGYAAVALSHAMMLIAQRKAAPTTVLYVNSGGDEDCDEDDEDGEDGDPFATDPQFDPSDWWKHSRKQEYARA